MELNALDPGNSSTELSHDRANARRSAIIHREIIQLGILIAAAVAGFVVTRTVAASNRAMSLGDAAAWYRLGQQALAAGNVETAIEDFRRATVRDRTDRTYVQALARALAQHRDDEAARGVLLTLRESSPDDAEINLEIARLAARRQDVAEASRFYHNALYAPWPAERADARRAVRLELIQFLLAHGQSGRAQSELLAMTADLPDEPAAHVQVARLFAEGGDDGHALEQFQRALQVAPDDVAALAGAGMSAFRLGRYTQARTFLGRVPGDLGEVAQTRDIVEHVVADDPLASRIGSIERRRRLGSILEYGRDRLRLCSEGRPGGQPTDEDAALLREADGFASETNRTPALEQDVIESGVDLVNRIATHVSRTCGPPAARDRALTLIGRGTG